MCIFLANWNFAKLPRTLLNRVRGSLAKFQLAKKSFFGTVTYFIQKQNKN